MPVYSISLPDPSKARGSDPRLSFTASGADAFAEQLQAALRTPELFERWKATQDEPDDVDPSLGATDPAATVTGQQADLRINLQATTTLAGDLFKHRLRLLAGSNWELRDVR
ncbi:hypothetical protein ATCM_16565 [Stenotrophomonas sp. ATCM1_4]|jgi:hypothetical protein|uniref:Uncharacterized protein n=1 Tax=Stenotrophomonas capsici TaxID=3110230 RepID=A0ABU5UZU2_9GAMM|nr:MULTISPECIES: hypothetical protein [unclassified Stenotrophomonas]MBD9536614.1 hypothetical protein [Stenotrophomonas sp. STM01]MEA5666113.1 hypothetical protein [Stenotrophomonas sp. MH1]TDB29123.1 hypothetical protein ATCM_16565 [Stenotrophomonas sp. ATCM1_4]